LAGSHTGQREIWYVTFLSEKIAFVDEVATLKREAEAILAKTCDECGKPESLMEGRGVRTLCKDHAKKFIQS
jgi:hypothetical protein